MPSVGFLLVLFAGEKIAEGIGKTGREAQHHAAEGFLMNFAGEIWVCLSIFFKAGQSIRRSCHLLGFYWSCLREGKLLKELEVKPSVRFLLVLFAGEKVGEGIGRTRSEAQYHSAEGSLMNLAVWFAGEKIGEGIGRIKREAQHQIAECCLMNLAGVIWVSLSMMCILF
ncbi:hypothetical protein RHMOL_Rhmol02G0146100 [Rhododendron molle]|uniref:Uncharacterized protein n=1 Tax=Rhododendron molle TaxID=49168 RepID=A0ACC0PPV0_RHOML|nr:hypothetical protein RHMOL_Rhmol02G0146100 [Rhododendron molle]